MHSVAIVAVISITTILIRFLPFIIFPEGKELPNFLLYLNKVLPAAIMGMLVVYCFRNISFLAAPFGLPELLATGLVVGTYLWKRSVLASIASGTVLYMILMQIVF